MLKGAQKKVIIVKDTQSGIFDEAYFIVKNSADHRNLTKHDMVSEAQRIISGSVINSDEKTKKPEKYLRPLWFFIGMLCSSLIFIVSLLIEQNYL